MSVCLPKARSTLIGVRGRRNWSKEADNGSHVEEIDETRWSWRTNFISSSHILGMYSTWMQTEWNYFRWIDKDVWITFSAGATENLSRWEQPHEKTVAWSYDVEGHALKCVERRCELANKKVMQLYKDSSLCVDDHHFKKDHKFAHKLSWNACIRNELGDQTFYGLPTNLHEQSQDGQELVTDGEQDWSHTFITQVTTDNIVMWLTRLNIADWFFFFETQTSGDLEDSKSNSGGLLCFFGSRPFVALSCMCKKQTSISHSSGESEIISSSAGLRMDGLLALDLWDTVIEVLRSRRDKTK